MSKKKPSKEAQDHFTRLSEMGCVVCEQPPIIHHCNGGSMKEIGIHKGTGQKTSDWLVLPLCPNHHNGNDGLHLMGVKTWEAKYGSQVEHLNEINGRLTYDLWERARQ